MKSWLIAIGVTLALALFYAIECWWFPLAHCFCCKGSGRHYRKDGKAFRDCWWCRKHPGRRWRIGRRVWNFFRRHVHT